MFKEQLLRELLLFAERKKKKWFVKEEFIVYLYHKYHNIKFETILRQLRILVNQGFLIRKKIVNKEWGFNYTVVYYIHSTKIKAYINKYDSQTIQILNYM